MANLILATPGEFCLIQQDETGRICQIGLTVEKSKLLQIILAGISSKEEPFIKMGKEHDLILKATVDAERKFVESELMIFGNWLLSGKVDLMIDEPNSIRKPMEMLLNEFKETRK